MREDVFEMLDDEQTPFSFRADYIFERSSDRVGFLGCRSNDLEPLAMIEQELSDVFTNAPESAETDTNLLARRSTHH